MRPGPKAVAPIAVLLVAAIGAAALVLLRTPPAPSRTQAAIPLVETLRVASASVAFGVHAQGTVMPRTESVLVSEVPGRIVKVSPRLASGGFFQQGEVLVRIDARDYEVALEGARAAYDRSKSHHALQRQELERVESLADRGAASQRRVDEAAHALRAAAAAEREARVAVARAEHDLERTRIRAPYAGRVREKHVDVGQYVTPGVSLATVYAVDYAEIRLPIRDAELAFLDLPLEYRDAPLGGAGVEDAVGGAAPPPEPAIEEGPPVRITGRFAGESHAWQGRIVRVEGALDPETRMVTVVARVDDPYGKSAHGDRPPLHVGLFVDAEIEGRRVDGLVEIPRKALRSGDVVVVVDAEDRLRSRRVEIVRADAARAWVGEGLAEGERICVSPLGVVVEGMEVRTRPAGTDGALADDELHAPPGGALQSRAGAPAEARS